MVQLTKSTSFIFTLFNLILFSFALQYGLKVHTLWLIILSIGLVSVYSIAMIILIIDWFQTRRPIEIKQIQYTRTK